MSAQPAPPRVLARRRLPWMAYSGRISDATGREIGTCGHTDHPDPASTIECIRTALSGAWLAAVPHPAPGKGGEATAP